MNDQSLDFDNEFRAMSNSVNPNMSRQFQGVRPPSVRRPQVWLQPSQEATMGEKLGNSWKTIPVGIGRPVTPFSSNYIKPVVL